MINPVQIETIARARIAGFRWFTSGAYNVNLIAMRTPSRVPGLFDDGLACAYIDDAGVWQCPIWRVTTDPGLTWLQDVTARADGIAALAPGQYRDSHALGLHRGRYEALVQRPGAKLRVYRDANHDGVLDLGGQIYTNASGINIHRASEWRETTKVGRYSAGCIVHAAPETFHAMMSLLHRASDRWGDSFSLTLIDWPETLWDNSSD